MSAQDLNVFQLARMAECADPDKPGRDDEEPSPGANFLMCIRDGCIEFWDSGWSDDPEEAVHEIVDRCIPVYTRTLWECFLDLGLYDEDPNELGEVRDMTQGAQTCLYIAGCRLARDILENYQPMKGLGGIEWHPDEDV